MWNEQELEAIQNIGSGLNQAVAQLKRIAKAQETIANPLLQVDKDGNVHTITPTCCGGLKNAIQDFLGDEICGGYEKPTWEKYSVETLKENLSAHTCKPRDESALAEAVEDALRMSALASKTKMEKGCVCSFCAGHYEKFTEVLRKYRGDA